MNDSLRLRKFGSILNWERKLAWINIIMIICHKCPNHKLCTIICNKSFREEVKARPTMTKHRKSSNSGHVWIFSSSSSVSACSQNYSMNNMNVKIINHQYLLKSYCLRNYRRLHKITEILYCIQKN